MQSRDGESKNILTLQQTVMRSKSTAGHRNIAETTHARQITKKVKVCMTDMRQKYSIWPNIGKTYSMKDVSAHCEGMAEQILADAKEK